MRNGLRGHPSFPGLSFTRHRSGQDPSTSGRPAAKWAACHPGRGVRDGAVLTGVEVAPATLGLMVVEGAIDAAFGAGPACLLLTMEEDVDLAGGGLKLDSGHPPRLTYAQNLTVELAIVHLASLPEQRARPPQSRKSLYYEVKSIGVCSVNRASMRLFSPAFWAGRTGLPRP